jgi:hypothetical protein
MYPEPAPPPPTVFSPVIIKYAEGKRLTEFNVIGIQHGAAESYRVPTQCSHPEVPHIEPTTAACEYELIPAIRIETSPELSTDPKERYKDS